MQDVVDAIIFSFKEVLSFKMMRLILLSGLGVTTVWIFIGYFFWDSIIALSGSVLSMVPFSMIRSNGAWMLSTFVWLQVVLVTFALVYAFASNFVLRSVSKERFSSFGLILAILTALFWAVVWFFASDVIHQQLVKLLTWLPFETIEKGIAFLIGFYIIYSGIVMSMIFVASALNTTVLSAVQHKHFLYDSSFVDNEVKTIKYTFRDMGVFILISLIAFPLFFIPVLNFIVQIVLWTWLVKDTFVYDTASMLTENPTKEQLKAHKGAIWSISAITTLFNFIPVFNVFGPFFGEIAMYHYLREQKLHNNL
jgi:hypothetical protein